MAGFVLKQNRTVEHEFTFRWQDGGDRHEADVTAEFDLMPRDALVEKIKAEIQDGYGETDATIKAVLVSFKGLDLEDENGDKLSGKDVLVAVRQDPTLSAAIFREYQKFLTGNA